MTTPALKEWRWATDWTAACAAAFVIAVVDCGCGGSVPSTGDARGTSPTTDVEEAAPKPSVMDLAGGMWQGDGQIAIVLPAGERIELVWLPAGEYLRGSPESERGRDEDEPQHRVRIDEGFFIGRYEVTQGEWRAVTGDSPAEFTGDLRLPLESVTWEECEAFCRKVSDLARREVRLPTEAEWEYACRAGTTTAYSAGDALTPVDANFDWTDGGVTGDEPPGRTMVAGSFAANAWGLFDMHGNVREWCADWYGPYPVDDEGDGVLINPRGPTEGTEHVLRGGCWDDYERRCRSAYRHGYRGGDRESCNGFRVLVPATMVGGQDAESPDFFMRSS